MLSSLKFVQGAVAKKDFVPALTHFAIRNRKIMGYNGQIAICSPINLDMEATPQAVQFVKAIKACGENIQFGVTPGNRLSIRSGSFKAFVSCADNESYPDVRPSGTEIIPPKDFLEALEYVAPFVAEDASKEWARGVLFRGSSVFATNNILIIEYWLGQPFPHEVNIPVEAINEVLRIGEMPKKLLVDENSMSFIYAEDRWLRTTLYSTGWPKVDGLFNNPGEQQPVPAGLFKAVKELQPFVDKLDSIYFLNNEVTTSLTEGEGASVDVPGVLEKSRFGASHLMLLDGVADTVDFSCYPAPCPFFGKRLRGVITGMRL